MKNMRVYKDGRRLVIVLEDAGAEMEDYVKHMLEGDIQKVEHLAPPPQMASPKLDLKKMQEIKPADTRTQQTQVQAVQQIKDAAKQNRKATVPEPNTGNKQPEIPKKQLPKFVQNAITEVENGSEFASENTSSQAPKPETERQEMKPFDNTARQREKKQPAADRFTERQIQANEKQSEQRGKLDNAKGGFIMDADTFVTRTAGNISSRPTNTVTQLSHQEQQIGADNQIQARKQPVQAKDIRIMNIFELKQFLDARREDDRLNKLLFERYHMSLDYFLNVKNEQDIRNIAIQLAM